MTFMACVMFLHWLQKKFMSSEKWNIFTSTSSTQNGFLVVGADVWKWMCVAKELSSWLYMWVRTGCTSGAFKNEIETGICVSPSYVWVNWEGSVRVIMDTISVYRLSGRYMVYGCGISKTCMNLLYMCCMTSSSGHNKFSNRIGRLLRFRFFMAKTELLLICKFVSLKRYETSLVSFRIPKAQISYLSQTTVHYPAPVQFLTKIDTKWLVWNYWKTNWDYSETKARSIFPDDEVHLNILYQKSYIFWNIDCCAHTE